MPPAQLHTLPHPLFEKALPPKAPPVGGKRLPRDEWEKRHGLEINSSLGSAAYLIDGVHQKYMDLALSACTDPQRVCRWSPDFISGVIEGDGCIMKKGFSIGVERGDELLIYLLIQFFQDIKPTLSFEDTFTQYTAARVELSPRLALHLAENPVLFKESAQQLFLEWYHSRKSNHNLLHPKPV